MDVGVEGLEPLLPVSLLGPSFFTAVNIGDLLREVGDVGNHILERGVVYQDVDGTHR